MQEYDRTSKWLIQHHGDSILRLAGINNLISWSPLQAEVVQPRQLPDGLIEATLEGDASPSLFVIEIATYPDARILRQALRDAALVFLDRDELPEVLVLVLHPKGNLKAAAVAELESPQGWTRWHASWKVIEMWTIPAEDLLATGDLGLIPWIPLAKIQGRPEPILLECRERIDRQSSGDEHGNLLAVIQVLIGLRYDDEKLLTIFGGEGTMIESPVLQRFVAKRVHRVVLAMLRGRFGQVPPETEEVIRSIIHDSKLDELNTLAAVSQDLATLHANLVSLANAPTDSDETEHA